MPVDMKETIAEAAWELILTGKDQKLTVKDIVEKCHITRQAFYYHFDDIPDLMEWVLKQNSEKLMAEALALEDGEAGLKYLFSFALNIQSIVRKGMLSGYRDEMELLLKNVFDSFLERVAEEQHFYDDYKRSEFRLIVRYHSRAIMGILRDWGDAGRKDMDQEVHLIWQILMGKVVPYHEGNSRNQP